MRGGYFSLFFIFLGILFSSRGIARDKNQEHIDSLLAIIAVSGEDSSKAQLMCDVLYAHSYYKPEEGLKYSMAALELAKKTDWKFGVCQVYYLTGRIYWRLKKFDQALKNHVEALSLAEKNNWNGMKTSVMIAIGQDYADQSNYPEALKYFNKAYEIAYQLGDKDQILELHILISWVCEQQGNYPEKTKYDFSALRYSQEVNDKYSIAICMANISWDYLALGNYELALQYLDSSIVPLKEEHDYINLCETYISMASIHTDHQNFKEALNYFDLALKIGAEIHDMNVLARAYRSKAGLFVLQGNEPEALKNFLSASEILDSTEDNQSKAELYIEIGACYTRLNKFSEAKKYFENAKALSMMIESESISNKYYQSVELLDSATGNWKDAYANYKMSVQLTNKLYNDENTKKIMQTSMQYEYDRKEAAVKAEQEKKDIRQRLLRNSIATGLGGSLLFLVVVYRQRNRISRARKRSDELLLNILPEEVADELKEKGSTEAKQFDEVTVMFTDFKGFTQISEKLTPAELVAEIDTCFKAFDQIITKHNIEKIKTIGDSYMCAGGLPVANTTNASDVLKAALEIQQFMQQHLQERKLEKKEIFEIRIGIHTGPVVAGIVGVKKFAYDIWGDTVNIASRMESSGEAGKINISGSTYQLIKDQFKCVHRGKIQAKNKGEIDMYFVE
ncbi:MAG: tetratricopeptide repeat protein [Bacteroidia bacterium]|nr:tetratricopeptide repeat protein [Bacteroidia bacterium]